MVERGARSFLIVALVATFALPLVASEQQLPFDPERPETNFATDFIEGRGMKARITRQRAAHEGSIYSLSLNLLEDSQVNEAYFLILFELEERGGTTVTRIQGYLNRTIIPQLSFQTPQVERNTDAFLTIGLIRSFQEPRENMVAKEFTVPIVNRFSIADGLVSAYQHLIIALWATFITYSITGLLKSTK